MCGEFHCNPVYFHIKCVTENNVRGRSGGGNTSYKEDTNMKKKKILSENKY